ncbi:Crp/Fnr family transcriptional regulator [Sphingobium bisphenolivorans]|uniref:Crp/Fnr family transcriptional regulator n=1 Tax=Sphingobium bisphenolivorans TaxID=1335760 RepID=UPI0003B7B88F|nr:Crp/Fnr family transcriptional regulator [Sphingobium bisphenolivorans]
MSPLVARLGGRIALSKEDKAALLALPHSVRTVQPGDYVIREGDIAHSCHVLLSGFTHRHRMSAYGTRHILGIHGEGDLLNLPTLPPLPAEDFVQALTVVQVAAVPIEDVLALSRARPAIGNALWTEMSAEVSVFRAWISNMGRRDARGRIAHLFCELVMRSYPAGGSDGCTVTLPLSQAELADATGMTTVHVNRTLKILEQEGFIRRQRRRIMIPDWRRLKELGDFRASAWTGRRDRDEDVAQAD